MLISRFHLKSNLDLRIVRGRLLEIEIWTYSIFTLVEREPDSAKPVFPRAMEASILIGSDKEIYVGFRKRNGRSAPRIENVPER
ncbi:predicted protein [Botrytis cinerea T4]|uniref:Uncharacterized protein n=1 Tax=Botryotinia fuckeliana (strain T4) TaxID=999810 RepID=G2YHN1_BOTF4|nr:predicted protein [Botrytis cinerea T4]